MIHPPKGTKVPCGGRPSSGANYGYISGTSAEGVVVYISR